MNHEWKTLTQVGRALWSEPDRSHQNAVETLSVVSLQDLDPVIMIEKAIQGLIARAARETASYRRASIQHPFYRLTVEERVILIGLHLGAWSYAKIARILKLEATQIPIIAWRARLNLSTFLPHQKNEKPLIHPPGTSGPRCPEYDAVSPWTQKFLDEQYPKRERLFLQNHLMACSKCLESLNRTRDLYYRIEKLIPVAEKGEELAQEAESLQRVWRTGYQISHPVEQTVQESLIRFFSRKETLWSTFLILGALLLILSFGSR